MHVPNAEVTELSILRTELQGLDIVVHGNICNDEL